MGLSVIDTSVLIGVLTPDDAHHEPAVKALRHARQQDHHIVIPVVAFSESLVAPYRRSTKAGREFEHDIMGIGRVEPVTREVASRAARLRAQRQLKLPDAFVVATGIELQAAEILTFDERWRTLDSRVRCLS